MRTDSLDVQPHDSEQLHEIDLVSDLIIACSQCAQNRLPRDVVDAILGIATNPRP